MEIVAEILLNLTIGRLVDESHCHDANHTIRREVLHIVGVLRLALDQLEDGTVEQSAERVVVELAHWHLVHVIVVLDQVLQILKHLRRVAAVEHLAVGILFLLRLGLHLSVKFDLGLERLV